MHVDEIRKRFSELYHLDEVITDIAKLGEAAVSPIGLYLSEKPEPIPHSRMAAVRALGLIGTVSALDTLKRTLFGHDLKQLDPVLAQSEYVVKNAVIEELVAKYPDKPCCDFIDVYERYRLPAAIQAIVKYHLTEAIPVLVASLEDDMLALRAEDALKNFGSDAVPALLQGIQINALDSGNAESRVSKQKRILAAGILGDIADKRAVPGLQQMKGDPDPNVAACAVAALIQLDPLLCMDDDAEILLKGAISNEWVIRDRCRAAVSFLGDLGVNAALKLTHLKVLHDLYGAPMEIPTSIRSWLITYVLENASSPHIIEKLMKDTSTDLLHQGIASVRSERAISNLQFILKFNDDHLNHVTQRVLKIIKDKISGKND